MQAWPASGLWALIAFGMFGTSVLLVALGLKRRFRGTDLHCAKCNYNLTGAASDLCPECGSARTAANVVQGERYCRPKLAMLGVLLGTLGLICLVQVSIARWNTAPSSASAGLVSTFVRSGKWIIADLKSDIEAHQLTGSPFGRTMDQHDPYMGPLRANLQQKIPAFLARKVTDPAMLAAARAELAAANQHLQARVLPAYQMALQSGKPADTEALLPLLDQLDRHMDRLLQVLRGR